MTTRVNHFYITTNFESSEFPNGNSLIFETPNKDNSLKRQRASIYWIFQHTAMLKSLLLKSNKVPS